MSRRRRRPYWLIPGPATCEFCMQTFALEMELRCAACDRAACEQCLSVLSGTDELVCAECLAEGID